MAAAMKAGISRGLVCCHVLPTIAGAARLKGVVERLDEIGFLPREAAIGVSHPLSVYVDTYGTGKVDEEKLSDTLREVMDLSPRGIREHLHLNRPIYARTAAYGHFGRAPDADGGFSWEKRDLVDALKSHLG